MVQQIVGFAGRRAIGEVGDRHLPSGVSADWYARSQNDNQRRRDALARTIELEIIPRMVLARRGEINRSFELTLDPGFAAADIAQFARSVLATDISQALGYLEGLGSHGATLEAIYLQLLAPTARHLGAQWDADLLGFGEVTVGLGRLQQLLHELEHVFPCKIAYPAESRRALIVPSSGEQHVFGTLMVAELLRRAGWDVWCRPAISARALGQLVKRNWFALAGLSASSDRRLETLSDEIRVTRQASRNPRIGIMVGGPIFAERPDLVAMVGADATAADGSQVAGEAEKLVAMMEGDL